ERGIFPGMTPMLDHFGIPKAIAFFKSKVEASAELEAKETVFEFLGGDAASASDLGLTAAEARSAQRRWALLTNDERTFIRELLVRFDLTKDQIGKVLGSNRASFGVTAPIAELHVNP